MRKASDRSRNLARALIAATVVLAFGPSAGGLAQDKDKEREKDAASAATTADEPRRGRQRRRAEEAAEPAETQGQAAAASATGEPAGPAAEVVEERLVCKSEKVLGTKISRRTCGTPEQWAARERQTSDAAQDAMQEIRSRSSFPAAPEVPVGLP